MRAFRLSIVFLAVAVLAPEARADFIRVSRNATVKEEPLRDADVLHRAVKGDELPLLQDQKENGYYFVRVPGTNVRGWIYKTLGRRFTGEPAPVTAAAATNPDFLTICSFNIQFLGNSNDREDEALAGILDAYDIVVVQELVSPPFAGTFPM